MQGQVLKHLKLLWIQAMVTRSSAHHVNRIAATDLKFESQYVDKHTLSLQKEDVRWRWVSSSLALFRKQRRISAPKD
jgi:hypothetical protein